MYVHTNEHIVESSIYLLVCLFILDFYPTLPTSGLGDHNI